MAKYAQVRVTGPDNATVSVDNKLVGSISNGILVVNAVEPGKHQIVVELEGFSHDTFELDLEEGDVARIEIEEIVPELEIHQKGRILKPVKAKLTQKYGALKVKTEPENCRIEFLGQVFEKTMYQIVFNRVPVGVYTLKLVSGSKEREEIVEILDTEVTELEVHLGFGNISLQNNSKPTSPQNDNKIAEKAPLAPQSNPKAVAPPPATALLVFNNYPFSFTQESHGNKDTIEVEMKILELETGNELYRASLVNGKNPGPLKLIAGSYSLQVHTLYRSERHDGYPNTTGNNLSLNLENIIANEEIRVEFEINEFGSPTDIFIRNRQFAELK